MSWASYLQLVGAALMGAALAYVIGDKSMLEMLAGGIIAAVLHYLPMK